MAKHNITLPVAELHRVLIHDPNTGNLYWRIRISQSSRPGSRVGCRFNCNGIWYRQVSIATNRYYEHRIVWAMTYGHWPVNEIDHINGDGEDNRICNLRAVSHISNTRNSKINSSNTSGVNGVVWRKVQEKWQARINVNGRTISLGYFVNLSDASKAREQANLKYGYARLHGKTKPERKFLTIESAEKS